MTPTAIGILLLTAVCAVYSAHRLWGALERIADLKHDLSRARAAAGCYRRTAITHARMGLNADDIDEEAAVLASNRAGLNLTASDLRAEAGAPSTTPHTETTA